MVDRRLNRVSMLRNFMDFRRKGLRLVLKTFVGYVVHVHASIRFSIGFKQGGGQHQMLEGIWPSRREELKHVDF